MKIKPILTIIFTALSAISIYAQDFREIRVSLDINADERYESVIVSQISEELRNLRNIVIVGSEPRFTIKILVLRPILCDSSTVNTAAILVNRPLFPKSSIIPPYVKSVPKQADRETLTYFLSKSEDQEYFGMISRISIEVLCKDIVAKLDGEVFEKARKSIQEPVDKTRRMVESFKEDNPEKPVPVVRPPASNRRTKKP
jgi:hypothetical protein